MVPGCWKGASSFSGVFQAGGLTLVGNQPRV